MEETSLGSGQYTRYVMVAAGDLLNINTGIPDHPSRSSTSEQPESGLLEPLGKRQKTGLVVYRQKRWAVSETV
jgi:hypothetical protein